MKMRSVVLFVGFLVSLQLYGQKKIVWFDVGAKVQYGATGIYNAALADNSDYNYRIGRGLGYGGKLGINFGYNGIAIDVMRNGGTHLHEKKGIDGRFPGNDETVEWSSTDVYLLYRNAKNLAYFELGPKISFLRSASFTDLENNMSDIPDEQLNKNLLSGVIGFGVNVMGNDGAFSGILGLRFEYGLSDLTNDIGKNAGAPVANPAIYSTNKSKASNIAFAGLVFELNWGIGYFGKAQCGGRSKFIMF
jgi:hypothetical protein